jgi:ABC-2 type transport system ATP-binding protein
MPEEPAFYTWMTAREYLRDFIAPLYRLQPSEAAQRADETLSVAGLSQAADRRIGGFSRGMRQRLGLAQVLIHRPKVLLLDEPVSALDPAGRKEILGLIESLRGQATILFSTHILADVDRVCDTIGIINHGRMVIETGREDLLARYATPLFEVESDQSLQAWVEQARQLPFVEQAVLTNHTARLLVRDRQAVQTALLRSLAEAGLPVQRFEMLTPSLEDVFLRLTKETG